MSKAEVRSQNTGGNSLATVTVQASRGGLSVSGVTINLKAEAEKRSGGHQHTTNRPAGGFLNPGGGTNTEGIFTTQYASPEPAGVVKILASSPLTSSKDSTNITVKVEGLLPFSGTGSYVLTGSKPAHPDNHYFANQAAIDDLLRAANQFAKAEWNTTGTMRLNDMSLESGGVFDIDTTWTRPHNLHRLGKSVDIENLVWERVDTVTASGKDTSFTIPKVKWVEKFINFMETEMKKWEFVQEGQTRSDIFTRTRRFPHFEWKGI